MTERKIVILGGGFGGISAALTLARRQLGGVKIVLISDQPHFQYFPALYRVVTGRSPLEVCVPLAEIFNTYSVELVTDRINRVDLATRRLVGQSGSHYDYDYLVLALGSETSYFGISGLPEFSFGFKSINEALRLKAHLHEVFATAARTTGDEQVRGAHLVVVGGGASGVELAGELACYARTLAAKHQLDPALITIDLIEGAPRLLPALPPQVSARVKSRLHRLGINIFLGRALMREEVEGVELKDMAIKAKTIIWTAGVKNNSLLAGITGLQLDKKGRVLVDDHLRAIGFPAVFAIGDGAATLYAGMAQTAVSDGAYVASTLVATLRGVRSPAPYRPVKPFYSIPVGPGWAATLLGPLALFGASGWFLRRLADLKYFWSILPPRQAWAAFRSDRILSESCPVCNPAGQTEFKK